MWECYCPVSYVPEEREIAAGPPAVFNQVQTVNVEVGPGVPPPPPGPVAPVGPVGPSQVQRVKVQAMPPAGP